MTVTTRPIDVIADYIADNISDLTRWDSTEYTGNVLTDSVNPDIRNQVVVMQGGPGGSTPPHRGLYQHIVMIEVFSHTHLTAFNWSMDIYNLFLPPIAIADSNWALINCKPLNAFPIDRGFIAHLGRNYGIEILVQFIEVE